MFAHIIASRSTITGSWPIGSGLLYLISFASLVVLTGCIQESDDEYLQTTLTSSRAIASDLPCRIASEDLPNLIMVHAKIYSGGEPQGESGFLELRSLRVKTVISVDGKRPDVETARKYGLRYVHLPHGYDGVPERRGRELAKAVQELEGPIYIHCHHGKHRSPAAASVACVSAGFIPSSEGMTVLKVAGTSPNYVGLYRSAQQAQPLAEELLDALEVEFPETAEIPPLAEAMVAMEQTCENLQLIKAEGWQSPSDHPDLNPAHEALQLREHFTELLRSHEVKKEQAAFKQLLRDSELAAQMLEDQLRSQDFDASQANRLHVRLSANCVTCHQRFRDVPRSE